MDAQGRTNLHTALSMAANGFAAIDSNLGFIKKSNSYYPLMIWFDGKLTSRAQVDATNAGALVGWGVFTTLAIRAGAPVFWAHHAARLARDADAARVNFPFDEAQLHAGLMQLLAAENIGDGLARVTGTQCGDGRWNASQGAHWSIIAQGGVAASGAPLRVEVSPFRVAARAPLAGVKTTSYLPYLHAWNDARARGFDEALLLTENDWVCEGARASVFWAKNGALFTPALSCGCLCGVGRAVVLERFDVRQGRYGLADFWEADEAFMVSGATGARAIGAIADAGRTRKWENGGPLTMRIQAEFWRHAVG